MLPTAQTEKQVDIQALLTKAINTLSKLDELYANGTIIEKRKIIGSIYPEKLIFDGNEYRTPRLNEAVRLIYTPDNFSQKR
jgi:site-specific DNA recombinase